ncbi:3'(2'),5'-bisphosphate nucleotidase CysQ [Coralloluteibacterium stylophorae]|uniref:3'(2'),5'-bisphosphate nucleotidase CysQ n=1 Tax=Coralloluteibacterium stylophorae TaxID=1776034 RepID=A0A8J7VVE4_9GAMM|nr:3'(2'),5'-bisphosphate nucleotidase CysQ [Coralloluteibacterium stylophorae]MBS7456097.1 3'(2'),5'-bisphosphate nucleotidase CysQ [Coralloluteibacterium stylophorae]
MSGLREACIAIARDAAGAILEVYTRDFEVIAKADESPVTAADIAAHRIIQDGLKALEPDTPLLSEEGRHAPWEVRKAWRRYWLIDPLDGTREFVKRNGEFTVNIALVEDGEPVLGIVLAPVGGDCFHAERGRGAFLRTAGGDAALASRRPAGDPLHVAASRSWRDPRVERMLAHVPGAECVGIGSSLKFCRIAEGRVDLYPRFGATCEWDTAAGQCVLEEAGGGVFATSGERLAYNTRESLVNPDFVAVGDPALRWRDWLDG